MIRVFIVDDHAVIRDGLARIFSGTSDIQAAGAAETGAAALRSARQETWDVLILDLTLPDMSGLEVLRQMKSIHPNLPVLLLTMYGEDQYAVRALKSGAAGYVTKGRPTEELLTAIRRVYAGRRYIPPTIAEMLAERLDAGPGEPHELLSDREFEVFRLIVAGRAPGDIASELKLRPSTVATYRQRIMQKLSVRTIPELVQYAYRTKLIE